MILSQLQVFSQAGIAGIEIAAVGDILLDRGVRTKIEKLGPEYPFEETKRLLSGADLAFGNLENPITNRCDRLEKKYSFRAAPEYAGILAGAGFDFLSLANNHSLDCGRAGLESTIENLARFHILAVGAEQERDPVNSTEVALTGGVRIGFAAFTAISPVAPVQAFAGVSKADPESVMRTVSTLRARADVVVASFHWGREYSSFPDKDQEQLALIAVRAGADIVLGHHPHVLQGIQLVDRGTKKRKALIAYSLGNFVFDSPVRFDRRLGETMILKLFVDREGITGAEIIPVLIDGFRPVIAPRDIASSILDRIAGLSNRYGTVIENGKIDIEKENAENGN